MKVIIPSPFCRKIQVDSAGIVQIQIADNRPDTTSVRLYGDCPIIHARVDVVPTIRAGWISRLVESPRIKKLIPKSACRGGTTA